MARQKQHFLIIDTETCGSLEYPICYDIGYAICDRNGNIFIKRSFVVADIFLDEKELMDTAYYHEKIPSYWKGIKTGERKLKTLYNIRKQILQDIKNFNVTIIAAYNMAFDKRALNNTIRICSKDKVKWFFPFGMKYYCIWNMACQVIMTQLQYIKFAERNDFKTAKGNLQTNAEVCYRFLTKVLDFEESHTGLEDVEIEVEIMRECFKKHKKMNKEIYTACWNIPQKKRKELIACGRLK